MDFAAGDMLHMLDLVGICVFALSGATLAVRARMDLFGVVVLAIVTAVSGGIIRGLLIGIVPPTAIADWRPAAVATASGALCFLRPTLLHRFNHPAPEPVFAGEPDVDYGAAPVVTPMSNRLQAIDPSDPSTWAAAGPNGQCPCGSGKKYKHRHGRLA